ncbi:hypothetical protein L593_00580 [Salinarchaeum sp. Harcht-Bsk1]|uniref:hypothetical protein n=1 Tax=Salinarchaeum sp. Harcht-Bsk1 TaxID=1333523 RepID=UPI0003423DAF|nr:hypothetical protein [Salinarchaeum sp. Harcht-Bsk1]AGN00071.1 hypothetical protein L593_00580 [Salinarchaeum sp. Harcht-Bsk1]
MSSNPTESRSADDWSVEAIKRMFDPEELRRRNLVSLGMDLLILVTVGFLAILFTKGFLASMLAVIPVATLLYFGWASSKAFFVSELLAIAIALLATYTYMLPY